MPKIVKKRKKNLKDVSVDELMQSSDESDSGQVEPVAVKGKSNGKAKLGKVPPASKAPMEADDEASDDSDESDSGQVEPVAVKGKSNGKAKSGKVPPASKAPVEADDEASDDSDEEMSDAKDDGDVKNDMKKHKHDLAELKKTDPDFYKFLSENDKTLLDFDASDLSDEEGGGGAHIPSTTLEEASEDSASDGEDADAQPSSSGAVVTVTMAQVNKWTKQLQGDQLSLLVLQEIIEAFQSAVAQVEGKAQSKDANFKVVGAAMFNSVIRMCVVNMPRALNNLLQLPKVKSDEIVSAGSCKKWVKVQMHVKKYLAALLQVLLSVAEADIVAVLLKHVYQMVPYVTASQKFVKGFVKKLVMFWSSGEETVRVLAFLSIIKITRGLPQNMLTFVLKTMYISYVKNCKFTSPSTWPLINFMKRSLVEVFALNDVQAYQYGFVYIRQLAIHLRNATTIPNKDGIKAVYNWQFVHCINFWAQLFAALPNSEVLSPLIYPLVQTIIGTIKLVPTEKNYPLRFHCLRALTMVSKSTGTFIPVLPFLTEAFAMTDFNKKSLKSSFKPLNFMCMLKLSKAELTEQGFKDGIVDQLFDLFFGYLNVESHRIGYPELVLPTSLQLKAFLKTCKVANYCKQIRIILDKMDENSKFITNKRKSVTITLGDTKAIEAWETQCQLEGTPISRYYVNFRKVKDLQMQRGQQDKSDKMTDKMVPQVNRKALMAKHKGKDRGDYTDLFTHDDDGDNSDTDFFSAKLGPVKFLGQEDDAEDNECEDLTAISDSDQEVAEVRT